MKTNRLIYSLFGIIVMTFILTPLFTKVRAQKRPDGEAKTANKSNPVPKDWSYVYEKKRGYGFYLPVGSTYEFQTINKLDLLVIKTAEPLDIDIFVLAYKDKTLTKEDLLVDAVDFLTGLGQKVTPGKLKGESDNYAVADATTIIENGQQGKLRILVGTDVTDNYIMIIGAAPQVFDANEKTIDTIWGSFEMWSGR